MRADLPTEQGVRACLQTMVDAYAQRRIDDAMARFVDDEDVLLYGTGADEKRVGTAAVRAQIERDWAQSDAIAIVFDAIQVSAAGAVAWAAADGRFRVRAGAQAITVPARSSFVLEQRGGRWLIAQAHFSTPAAGQAEGSSF